MPLLTERQRQALLTNGARRLAGQHIDPFPVVKWFTPDASATWLIVELDPEDPDIAYGLCDLGLSKPELGSVRLSEIEAVRGPRGLPVERDLHFEPDQTLSAYAEAARLLGRIYA